ncbi:MAG: PAS domain S-box protein [Anaerolineae bacterium]|nr:PAS domain S-box protein [Anaerolineae bacterium]
MDKETKEALTEAQWLEERAMLQERVSKLETQLRQMQAAKTQQLNTDRLEALLKLNQMEQASLKEICDFAMEEAVRLTGSRIGYLAFMNEDETVLTMYAWSKTAMAACNIDDKPIHYAVEATGLWGEVVRQRRPIITNDYAAPNPWKKGYPPGHVALQRHMNVPVFSDGRIVLVAGVGNKADPYDDLDVQQLTLLMEGMWRLIERWRAAQSLQESEKRFRELADLLPQGVSEIDAQGNVTYINRVAYEMFGYTSQDLTQGLTIFQALTPEEHAHAARTFRAAITGMASAESREYYARRKDGSTFPAIIYTSPIIRQGEITGLRSLIMDVTERKQAEEKQQQILERVRRQQATVVALSLHPAFSGGDVAAAIRFLTETVAAALDVARAGVWLLENDGEGLRCHDLYLCDTNTHQSGQELAVVDFPAYFAALKHGRVLDARDACTDPRTCEFNAMYLKPNRITSLLDATIRLAGDIVGVVCLEHVGDLREWQTDEITFAGEVADQIAQVLTNAARKRTEAALHESLEKYRVLFESFPLGIIITDQTGYILEANPASERLLNLSFQEHGRRHIDSLEWQIIRPDGSPMPAVEYASVRALAENRLVENVVMGVARPDGNIVWLNVTAAPIPLEGYGVAVTYSDISERIQAQHALRQERDLSRALAEAAALINRTLDQDAVLDLLLEQVNHVIPGDTINIMLIGTDRRVRVARGRNYAPFGTESFIASLNYEIDRVPTLRQMAETGEPLLIPDTAVAPGWVHAPEQAWLRAYIGVPICVRGVTIGFLNVNSATPGCFTPLHADILRAFADHAAVALENARLYQAVQQELAAREQVEAALREREAYFRALFEQASDAIFINDTHDTIIDVNRRACELLGYTRDELLQHTIADLQAPERRGTPGQVIQAELAQYNGMPFEGMDIRQDGVRVPVEITTAPLQVGDKSLALSIVRDITERKAMETRLHRQDRLAAVGQLAAGIAHDFRNLLTSIILYAQLGRRKVEPASPIAQYLETIVGESHKATDLIQQILDFSSRTSIDLRPLDLVALVRKMLAVLQRTLPENIHITLEVPLPECMVEGDAGRLQQVLTNLALNARDAMPEGGDLCIGVTRIVARPGAPPPLPEMVDAIAPPAWICLSVADEGAGMSEEVRAHLFEPFFTTKEEGRGTGLGLAQVYGITLLHHGYIGVETAVGKGTTFCIYLPAFEAVADEGDPIAVTPPAGQGETLLLVEDNAHLREAAQSMLTALGYRVLTAANGREALAVYQADPQIALLITDLVMPEIGGKVLFQTLRARVPHLKALVMTGYTAEESLKSLQADGFLEVIRKPFDAGVLAQAVHRALGPAAEEG